MKTEKLSTYERLEVLFDSGSFCESSSSPKSLFVTGEGKIDGRSVYVVAGRMEGVYTDEALYANLCEETTFFKMATHIKKPLVFIHDNPVGDQQKASPILRSQSKLLLDSNAMGGTFYSYARLIGQVPTVSVVLGRISSSQTFHTVMSDVTVMSKEAGLCMGRPDMVKEVLGEDISFEELAGPTNHSELSGIVSKVCATEGESLLWARQYLAYFPLYRELSLPVYAAKEPYVSDVAGIIPDDANKGFNIKELIYTIVDAETFLELNESFAKEVVVGLSYINGRSVGIVANNSIYKGGVLFTSSCQKISKFVALCDNYHIPLLFLADIPGFMIGSEAEKSGIIGAGGELFKTIARATVAKVSIVVRKAYTGGVYAMAGAGFDSVGFFALPNANLGIYSIDTIERLVSTRLCSTEEQRTIDELKREITNPQLLVEQGLLDGVILPSEIRQKVILALQDYYYE